MKTPTILGFSKYYLTINGELKFSGAYIDPKRHLWLEPLSSGLWRTRSSTDPITSLTYTGKLKDVLEYRCNLLKFERDRNRKLLFGDEEPI